MLGAVKPEEVKSNVHDATVEIPAEPVVGPQIGQASGLGRADQGIGAATLLALAPSREIRRPIVDGRACETG